MNTTTRCRLVRTIHRFRQFALYAHFYLLFTSMIGNVIVSYPCIQDHEQDREK